MIIVSENNYKSLENTPHVKNPQDIPDIILYSDILKKEVIEKITDLLKKLELKKNGQIWFVDNPLLDYNENLPIQPFPLLVDQLREDVVEIIGRFFNSCLVTRYDNNTLFSIDNENIGSNFVVPSILIGSNRELKFKSLNSDITRKINIHDGSLLVEREYVKDYWTVSFSNVQSNNTEPFYILSFYRIYPPEDNLPEVDDKKVYTKKKLPLQLTKIYLNSKMRVALMNKIRTGLSNIRATPEGYHCFMKDGVNQLRKYINIGKLIGTGDWGNVYSACLSEDTLCRRKFAIKMSRITDEDFNDPYTETSASWYEIWMLKDIIKPLVKQNICPNLPLFIDTFLCDKCDFVFRKGENTHPCIITVMELASGDLREYLKFKNPTDEEIYTALFQIMAGLHAIQMSSQILNNDIKAKNILYYDVEPGGYWHYKIDTYDFYVPNFGKMFVLNDFGVSTLYDPNFQLYPDKQRKTFNLGSRFAINIDEKFSPVEAKVEYTNDVLRKTSQIKWVTAKNEVRYKSYGATYKIDRKTGQVIMSQTVLTPLQKSYLFRKGVSTNPKTWAYFEHPYIIPPFEFYNDVQDTLRTFVGGKRTTQNGNHTRYPSINKYIVKNITPYLGIAVNAKERQFTQQTYHVLAGSFIKKFFTQTIDYTIKPKGKKISFYDMNKCKACKQY